MSEDSGHAAAREGNFALATVEERALRAMARRLPGWIRPDDLTTLGVLSALGICAAYVLANESPWWLWAASALLVVQWLGDSLDGTLARVRRIERPRYGYYLDHLVDAFSTVVIGLGLGFSPHMLLSVGAIVVAAYLVLSINVYLEAQAFGRFAIGFGRFGPTELRLVLIALNTALFFGNGLQVTIAGTGMTVLDALGIAIAATMLILLVGRAWGNLRELAAAEPPAPRLR